MNFIAQKSTGHGMAKPAFGLLRFRLLAARRAAEISFRLPVILLCLLTGCSSLMYYHDRKTGLYERRGDYFLEMFTDSVDADIKRESRGEQVKVTWPEYWIGRCESVYRLQGGEALIEYVVKKRREAGLPDIPEIDARSFN